MPPSAPRSLAAGAALAALLAAAACAPRAPAPAPLLPATVGEDVPAIRAAVGAFIGGESLLDERVDTLLASGADFVTDGVVLERRPRLAGVPGRGTGTVDGMRFQVAGDYAWAVVGYRWVGNDPDGEERGIATFILQRHPAGWRIHHVHSSHVARWTR